MFYRSTGEWPVLIDLLGRRARPRRERQGARRAVPRDGADLRPRARRRARRARRVPGSRPARAGPPRRARGARAARRSRLGDPEDEALAARSSGSATLIAEPKERARRSCRAAELAQLHDWDKAQELFERARKDDPDLAPAVDGLASLLRDRGQLAEAITLLVNAAERPTSRPSARAGSSMPPTSASRSATPTGRSSSIAMRATPIRRTKAGRRARRAVLGQPARSSSSCRSSTSCAARPTIRARLRELSDPAQQGRAAARRCDAARATRWRARSSSIPTTSRRAASSPTCCSTPAVG